MERLSVAVREEARVNATHLRESREWKFHGGFYGNYDFSEVSVAENHGAVSGLQLEGYKGQCHGSRVTGFKVHLASLWVEHCHLVSGA